jgi:hypothetical protein
MTAMTQKERNAKTAAKRASTGEVELRHKVRSGIREMLAELMRWHGIKEISEAVQLMALNADHVVLLPPATGIEPLRHYARPGLMLKLSALAGDSANIALVVESLIVAAHSLGPECSAHLLAVPRHEIELPENVARALRKAGAAEAARMDRCEA